MNGAAFQTPPRSYGQKRRFEDDTGSSGRSYRRRGNDDFPGSAGSFRRSGGPRRDEGPPPMRPVDRFKQDLWKFGDEDSPAFGLDNHSLLAAAKHAEDMFNRYREDLCEGFRIAVTELPHKLPYYACIVSLMDRKVASSAAEEGASFSAGHAIVGHIIKGFQNDLLERKWTNVRLGLHFFALLAALPRPLVTTASLVTTIQSFAAVTEEFGVGANRADECARIALDGLLRLPGDEDVSSIDTVLRSYIDSRRSAKAFLHSPELAEQYDDALETLYKAYASGSKVNLAPEPVKEVADQLAEVGDFSTAAHSLPTIVVPLDVETDAASGYSGTRVELVLFDDETVPARTDVDGAYLRSLVSTVIDVFEVNRKDAAKYLLELPRWLRAGTFKPKGGAKAEDEESGAESTWIFEHSVIEAILGALFALPTPRYNASYYASLIVELCKASPATVAPAMGKCVRRIYAGLGEQADGGLSIDADGARRFCEWFSIHLSNFSYNWRWAEWQDDLSLPDSHPKKAVINRILELEVRYSYFDRIKDPLPEPYKEGTLLKEEAPGPAFAYDDAKHPRHTAASNLVEALRNKQSVDDVKSELRMFRETLQESGSEEDAEVASAELAIQAVLHVGSRSFSHLLNVVERYIELLRDLSGTATTRKHLLAQVFSFWRRNPHFLHIVVDKLLQYRVIESTDVLDYLFNSALWTGFQTYDLLSATLTKAFGRAKLVQARLDTAHANGEETERHQEALENSRKDADAALVHAAKSFAALYAAQEGKMEDGETDWSAWWVKGWFASFVRTHAVQLSAVHDSLQEAIPADSPVRELLVDGARQWSDFVGRA